MSEPEDMSTPVTRGELRHELAELENRVDKKFDSWAAVLVARMDAMGDRLASSIVDAEHRMAKRMDEAFAIRDLQLVRLLEGMEKRLHEELARHVRAFEESMRTMISVVDDKYADLPGRVTALEDNRAPTPPRKRRRRAS